MTLAPAVEHTAPMSTLTATYGELRDALTPLAAGVSNRGAVPILEGVLIDFDGDNNRIVMTTFDFETHVQTAVRGSIDGAGRAVVRYRELTKMLDALVKGIPRARARSQPAALSLYPDGQLTVAVGESAVPLDMLPPDEFLTLPEIEDDVVMTLNREDLVAATARVNAAAGNDDTLPHLTGMHVAAADGDDRVRLECSDRFRATCAYLQPQADITRQVDALPAAKKLESLVKHLPGEHIHVRLGDASSPVRQRIAMTSSAGATELTFSLSNVSDQEFPPLHKLMPNPHDMSAVELDRADAMRAAQQAEAVLTAKGDSSSSFGHGVVLEKVADDAVALRPNLPEQRCTVPALRASISQGLPSVGFNPKYLLAALRNFSSDRVTVRVTSPAKPTLFTDADDPTREYRHLLMPLRLT